MENDNFQAPLESAGRSDTSNVQRQIESLQHLITSVLVLLIVVTGTFCIYLLRQRKITSAELEGIRPQALNIIAQYEQKGAPLLDDFIKKLTDYGKTHADFMPVLAKYGLNKPLTSAPPAAVSAPASAVKPGLPPAASPSQKK